MPPQLNHGGPTRGKDVSRMAHGKRQYGSGCLLKNGKGWVIRWRELEIAPNGHRGGCCGTKGSNRCRGARHPRLSLARSFQRPAGQHRCDRVSRSGQSRPNGKQRCCRCTSTRHRSIGASCSRSTCCRGLVTRRFARSRDRRSMCSWLTSFSKNTRPSPSITFTMY